MAMFHLLIKDTSYIFNVILVDLILHAWDTLASVIICVIAMISNQREWGGGGGDYRGIQLFFTKDCTVLGNSAKHHALKVLTRKAQALESPTNNIPFKYKIAHCWMKFFLLLLLFSFYFRPEMGQNLVILIYLFVYLIFLMPVFY